MKDFRRLKVWQKAHLFEFQWICEPESRHGRGEAYAGPLHR